jgi:hypothetical protein
LSEETAQNDTLWEPNIDWVKLSKEKQTLKSKQDALEIRISKIADKLEANLGSKVSGRGILQYILSNFEDDPDKLMLLGKVLMGVAKIQKDLTEASKKIQAITVIESDRGWFAGNFLDHEPLIKVATEDMIRQLEESLQAEDSPDKEDDSQED